MPHKNSKAYSSRRTLQFETLEKKQLLTTFLVNFNQEAGNISGVLNDTTAADFAVADPLVDLSTPVVVLDQSDRINLAGSDGATFNIETTSAGAFTTPNGFFADTPILDSYLTVTGNTTANVTVSGLDEIAAGEQVTLTLYGVGDNSNQESIFTVFHAGQEVGGGETNYDSNTFTDTFITVSFTKVAGFDSIEIDFMNAGNGSNFGALNGFSITTGGTPPTGDTPPPALFTQQSLLVNFFDVTGPGEVTTASAADFQVFDPTVNLAAPVNLLQLGTATDLAGFGDIEFDVSTQGVGDFTTNRGPFQNNPIVDSYLFNNGGTGTVTVSSLEEIADGATVTLTLFGVGDQANQESIFTVSHGGEVVGTGETDVDSGIENTFVTVTFTKLAGFDEIEISFTNAGNGSSIGAFNGFSLTVATPLLPVRINAGGANHVDLNGNLFVNDSAFLASGRSSTSTINTPQDIFIVGSGGNINEDEDADDILFQTARVGDDFGYDIDIANGFYTVRLLFAEIEADGLNQRVFDVEAEGDLLTFNPATGTNGNIPAGILDDLDIFQARFNAFTPGDFSSLVVESGVIEITDGSFSLDFESVGADGVGAALISAVEILPVVAPQVLIVPSGGSTTVVEDGATDTYEISLTTPPISDVTITIDTGNEITANSTTLVFTPGNFNQAQTVTLTAIDDNDQEGPETLFVTHTATSADPAYDGLETPALTVSVVDDDAAAIDFDSRNLVSGVNNLTSGAFGPDGRLYVATTNGEIFAYTLDDNNNVIATESIDVIDDLPNTINGQPVPQSILGIAFDPTEIVAPGETPTIYASRSLLDQNFSASENLFLNVISTIRSSNPNNSQTRFDTVENIITGLPVSGFDHGINSLEFTNEGELLINVGGNTNAGVLDGVFGSDAPESPFSGALLRAAVNAPDFNGNIQYEFVNPNDPAIAALAQSAGIAADPNNQIFGEFVRPTDDVDVEVFAAGLRNSFDSVITTDGRVFATDNGPNGIAEDELNFVPEGTFLGHPNPARALLNPIEATAIHDPDVPSSPGFTAPLTDVDSSTNGIDEFRSEVFGGQLRGQIFTQQFNNVVTFFEISEDGSEILNFNTRNDVASGLDILVGLAGTIIGVDRNSNSVTIAEPVDPLVTTPTAFDILSYRGPAVGGNLFFIGGTNFDTQSPLSDTTVTFGGVEATVTAVGGGRITGILPALQPGSFLDVAVTNGGVTSVLSEAFLPIGDAPPLVTGDFNGDTVVDLADFDVFVNNFGSTGNLNGDNNDGVVNAADFVLFRDSVSPPAAEVSAPIVDGATAPSSEPAGVSTVVASASTGLEGFSTALLASGSPSAAEGGVSSLATSAAAETADRLFLLSENEQAEDEQAEEADLLDNGLASEDDSAIDEALAADDGNGLELDWAVS